MAVEVDGGVKRNNEKNWGCMEGKKEEENGIKEKERRKVVMVRVVVSLGQRLEKDRKHR